METKKTKKDQVHQVHRIVEYNHESGYICKKCLNKKGKVLSWEDNADNFFLDPEELGSDVRKIIENQDPEGSWSETVFDNQMNEVSFRNSEGYSSRTLYNKEGKEVSFQDSEGYWMISRYDRSGNVRVSDSHGKTWEKNSNYQRKPRKLLLS